MSKAWPKVRLGDVLTRRMPDTQVSKDGEYQFAGVYCFGRGVFRSQLRQGTEFAYSVLTKLRAGEFIYPKLMAWEGAFGLVPKSCDGCYVSPEFPVFEINRDQLEPKFLDWMFKRPSMWEAIAGGSTGTNVRRQRLNPSDFLNAVVALPTLANQKRIVDTIEKHNRELTEARLMRKEADVDSEFLPSTMAHSVHLDEAEKQRQGWKRVRLGSVLREVDDAQQVELERSYPNLGIFSYGRGLFPKPPITGMATSAKQLRRVKEGQFIYSRLFAFEGAYGHVCAAFDGAFVSQEYPTFECDSALMRIEFIAAYFKSPGIWSQVARGSKGLGDRRQRVQPAQVLSHELWLPPLTWQTKIAEVQAQVDNLKRHQAETATELDALLPAILDKAFKGEL